MKRLSFFSVAMYGGSLYNSLGERKNNLSIDLIFYLENSLFISFFVSFSALKLREFINRFCNCSGL